MRRFAGNSAVVALQRQAVVPSKEAPGLPETVAAEVNKQLAAHKRQGDQVAITGRLTFQTWETDGQRRSTVKVTAEPRGVEFLTRRRNDTDHTE